MKKYVNLMPTLMQTSIQINKKYNNVELFIYILFVYLKSAKKIILLIGKHKKNNYHL